MNILINSTCNANCKFCFEPKSFKQMPEMTLETFKDIIDWLCYSYQCSHAVPISILGGEPTLHSRFSDILEYLASYMGNPNIKLLLITNGIKVLDYIDQLSKIDCEILLNYSATSMQHLINVLDAACKHNIKLVPSMTIDNDSVAGKVHELGSLGVRQVRLAAASNKLATFEHFYKQKDLVLEAYAVANSYGMVINMDCCKIPKCIFTEDDKAIIRGYKIDEPWDGIFNAACCSNADILPNGKLVHCMPLYEDSPKFSYFDFSNSSEAYRHTAKLAAKQLINKIPIDSTCGACDEFQKGLCSAGCLGMSAIKY